MTEVTTEVSEDAVQDETPEVDERANAELERRRRKAELLKKSRETRATGDGTIEVRDAGDGILTVSGLACRTGVEYNMGSFSEIVMPGSFRRSLSEQPDVQFVVNHGAGGQLPLARTKAGTLRLEEGSDGLLFEAELDASDPDAQRLARAMRRGDVDGASFAFSVTSDSWADDLSLRTITGVSLNRGDVSVVNQGANPAAFATVRSAAIEALAAIEPERFVAALVEWRDHTLLEPEARAGKTLSGASMEVLSQVLDLVATADDAVDEAQPLLATLMGVANPDDETEALRGLLDEQAAVAEEVLAAPEVRTVELANSVELELDLLTLMERSR